VKSKIGVISRNANRLHKLFINKVRLRKRKRKNPGSPVPDGFELARGIAKILV
jgi:hypothetical protein